MRSIAYLGPEHTNTHVAAQKRFGRRCQYIHAPTVDEVFHLVERRQANYGVVPIENSLAGSVTHTLDRFINFVDTPVKIHGEIEQPIQHSLIVHRVAKLEKIGVVYSHPQALAQCSQWLDTHLPNAQREETDSTAEAVAQVLNPFQWERWMERSRHVTRGPRPYERAAIARMELARERKLRAILIPQERDNKTRFLVLGLGEPKRAQRSKTSILFSVKDRPGALHDALLAFKRERINMTKIESRPSKRKAWEYLFFIDIEGHESELRVKRALAALQRSTSLLRVLGSYPVAR